MAFIRKTAIIVCQEEEEEEEEEKHHPLLCCVAGSKHFNPSKTSNNSRLFFFFLYSRQEDRGWRTGRGRGEKNRKEPDSSYPDFLSPSLSFPSFFFLCLSPFWDPFLLDLQFAVEIMQWTLTVFNWEKSWIQRLESFAPQKSNWSWKKSRIAFQTSVSDCWQTNSNHARHQRKEKKVCLCLCFQATSTYACPPTSHPTPKKAIRQTSFF